MSSLNLSLLQAVTSNDEGAVKSFLAQDADVDARNSSGQTPLILAIISGHDHVLRLLLEAGADPLLRDHTQLNAIDWAKRKGRNDLAQILRTNQPANSSATLETDRKKTTPSLDELRNARSVSSDEKSRKWLAGIKRRLEEQEIADRKNTKEESVSGQRTEPSLMNAAAAPPAIPEEIKPELRETGPTIVDVTPETGVIDKVNPEIDRAGLVVDQVRRKDRKRLPSSADATRHLPPQAKTETSSTYTQRVKVASQQPTKPATHRKRCPQCNTIYNSELLAYCAYHVVPLVPVNEPIVTAKKNDSAPVLWILVLITLSLAGVAGMFLSGYLYRRNYSQVSTAPKTTVVQKGMPVLGSTLVGKSVNLPAAEIAQQAPRESGTITVRVVIDRGGRVVSATTTEGDQTLREAVIKAAQNSTFSIEKLRGRGTQGTITYTFSQ